MEKMAEQQIGANVPVGTCIVTVPDYFTQEQRNLMTQILNLAGCHDAYAISNSIAGNALPK